MNANIIYMMNVLSLFSIFGSSSCGAVELNGIQHGNFTIQRTVQTEKGSGTVLNKNYDTRSYLVEYRILYKGKKIKFPGRLQKGTGYSFPWRVYILQDAPVPALIAGSQNMFLITEEQGKVRITPLNHHESRFGSLQWLDSKNGHPGDEIQIHDPQNDNYLDSSIVFKGGKYLLINRFTVLDIKTLASSKFNKNNIYEHEGWRIALDRAVGFEIAVGFSETFNQVVFGALKLDDKEEGRYYTALAAFDYKNDTISIVPFNRTALRLQSLDDINSDWVTQFFKWDDGGKLTLRTDVNPPMWKGKINFIDEKFIHYELYPVKESMVSIFLDFIKRKFGNQAGNQFSIIDQTNKQSIELVYKIESDKNLYYLTYHKTEMKLRFDRDLDESHSDKNREMIISVADGFNEELLQGQHQGHFGKYKGD